MDEAELSRGEGTPAGLGGDFLAIPLVAGLLVMAILLSAVWAAERQAADRRMHEDLDRLAQMRTSIESQLNQAANVSVGLAAMIEINQGLDPVAVRLMGQRMLERTPVIRSFAIAPDNVIRMSIPLDGNRAAIGVDLSRHPIQKGSLQRAMRTGQPVLGGPYELVQGGYAVIHRVPVFFDRDADGQRDYWGVVSTPIDVMDMFHEAGAREPLETGDFAARGMDGFGVDGAVFLGNPALFESLDTLKTPVIALDGRWQLAMSPSAASPVLVWSEHLAKLLAVLSGLLVMWMAVRWQTQQRRLIESEHLLRDVTSNISDVVFRADKKGRLAYVNPAYERLVGCSPRSPLGGSWIDLFPESERGRIREAFATLTTDNARLVLKSRLVHRNGQDLPVELRVERLDAKDGGRGGLVGTLTDLSDRHALEQLEGLATAVFERAGDAIVVLDRQRRVLAANPGFERLTGIPSSQVVGERLNTPRMMNPSRSGLQNCLRGLRNRGHWQGELPCRLPDGRERMLNWSMEMIRDNQGHLHRYVAVITDVTSRHQELQAMYHRAHHDGLTELLNRAGLEERFEQARRHALRQDSHIALAFVDLNGFKTVNDTLGHHVGDEVLREVASRLKSVGRGEDIVARLGGDEFVVAFYGVHTADSIQTLAANLRERIEADMVIPGIVQILRVQASIGFALFPDEAETLLGLMRRADRAMYEAKSHGEGSAVE
ncbi:diguanylate cyclase [Guyparkeria sp. 1SP6A2]|nr:diguanylate cyclase [Guyparkeria sp. 1SP6A2]